MSQYPYLYLNGKLFSKNKNHLIKLIHRPLFLLIRMIYFPFKLTFTMVRTGALWKCANLLWNISMVLFLIIILVIDIFWLISTFNSTRNWNICSYGATKFVIGVWRLIYLNMLFPNYLNIIYMLEVESCITVCSTYYILYLGHHFSCSSFLCILGVALNSAVWKFPSWSPQCIWF